MDTTDLHNLFKDKDFNTLEPSIGHTSSFEKKLNSLPIKNAKNYTFFKIVMAACIAAIIGFFTAKNKYSNNEINNLYAQESFLIKTLQQEFNTVEKYRTINTEALIENALDKIENLEEQQKSLYLELQSTSVKIPVIKGMLINYQKRISILEELINRLKEREDTYILKDFPKTT